MKRTAGFVVAGVAMLAVAASGETQITGTGATFPYPMYSKWFNEYRKLHPDIAINYQSRGSGAGIQQVTAGTVDFGASDGPMNDMQLKEFQDKRGCEVLHFPTVLGADVPTYNIAGVTQALNFTAEALAGIYLGKITKWNDPEIAKANPGVKLPNTDIVVVHRSDSSGTTFIWTDYLSKVSKEWEMKAGRGTAVNWPVGLGGQGNEGVMGQVKQTPNSIGYVELIYALQNKVPFGKVKNPVGEFVEANLASVTAAAAGAAKNMPDDFRVSITNASGKGAYPISSFTWLLIPAKISDPAKKKALTDFLAWMLKDGQTMTQALSYAPLPKEVVAKETKAIAKIK
ncbi:MAG TPA: phosphate ABC transporter substrate-binding protein PstS [Bryobacteraceae bacterium]|nr:phosphate ABC transporter substrate-binding protein PstS [Bryobacteraceae bacterium]